MTDEEVYKRSTPAERRAVDTYRQLQKEAIENGGVMGETALLRAGEVMGIIVRRNQRLGLCK